MLLPLSRGLFAEIDDEDFPLVEGLKFWAEPRKRTVYARSKRGYLHALITGHRDADHIDRNGLNNKRSNLRKTNRREQAMNTRIRDSKSGFRYVYFDSRKGRYYVRTWDGKRYHFWGYINTIGL